MSMNMPPAVYWYKDQIAVIFHAGLSNDDVINNRFTQKAMDNQGRLNQLLENYKYQLAYPASSMSAQQSASMSPNNAPPPADSLGGIYYYPTPTPPIAGQEQLYDMITVYNIVPALSSPTPPPMPTQGGNTGTGGMGGMGGMSAMDGMGGDTTADVIPIQVLKQLYAKKDSSGIDFDGMPVWFYAGTDEITHGCPITPPFPAGGYSKAGQWKFMSPQVANSLSSNNTGAGVTVFVLDTFPTADQIKQAASNPGCDNPLLQGMANGMVSIATTKPVSEVVATPPAITLNRMTDSNDPQGITTGKDLYGNLVGFSLIDHGLTIAGIIRDLAPEANIECIRILNDHGVGILDSLLKALNYILLRISKGGDLFQKPVVINLSLVIGPPEGDLARLELDDAFVKTIMTTLHSLIKNLMHGAILVASAGNDTDPRDPMHAPGIRLGPRYPAAFAYDLDSATAAAIIPVGAINGQGEVASYSNYPGPDGIAAYGGEIPTPYPANADPTVITQLDPTVPFDAVRGVYSSATFPALSMTDKYPTSPEQASEYTAYPAYPAPDASGWTCWVGTSFATPVISALAACLLQGQNPKAINVRQMLKDSPATQQVMWTGLSSGQIVAGPAIMVMQEFHLSQGDMPTVF